MPDVKRNDSEFTTTPSLQPMNSTLAKNSTSYILADNTVANNIDAHHDKEQATTMQSELDSNVQTISKGCDRMTPRRALELNFQEDEIAIGGADMQ